jgi:hypothetical protein
MRGADGDSELMFMMSRLDVFAPANHRLRPIRVWLNDALGHMDSVQGSTQTPQRTGACNLSEGKAG